jgi:hypothetical protein
MNTGDVFSICRSVEKKDEINVMMIAVVLYMLKSFLLNKLLM